MYQYIYHPISLDKININSKKANYLIHDYLNQLGGRTLCKQLSHPICCSTERCTAYKRNEILRCRKGNKGPRSRTHCHPVHTAVQTIQRTYRKKKK